MTAIFGDVDAGFARGWDIRYLCCVLQANATGLLRLTGGRQATTYRAFLSHGLDARVMRVRNSLRSAKVRDKNCRVVRRRGRVYVINKKNPRMKCRQG